ncbi:unnamed protein product, partial [Symbiodinium necroappetens]
MCIRTVSHQKTQVKETERELTPLIAGDWEYYTKWLDSGPIERLTLKPERPDRLTPLTGPSISGRDI